MLDASLGSLPLYQYATTIQNKVQQLIGYQHKVSTFSFFINRLLKKVNVMGHSWGISGKAI
jgi:hypothetical protein